MSFKHELARCARVVPTLVSSTYFKTIPAKCSEPPPSPTEAGIQKMSDEAPREANTPFSRLMRKSSNAALHALASDIQEVVLAVWSLVRDFAGPLADAPKLKLFRAAKSWAGVQQAAVAQCQQRGSETVLPEHCERWMRYTAAAFGAHKAGKLFHDVGAAHRERLEAARAIASTVKPIAMLIPKIKRDSSDCKETHVPNVAQNARISENDNSPDFPRDEREAADDTNKPQSWKDKLAIMKAALAQQKQRLMNLRAEEQEAVRSEQAREKEAVRVARAKGKEALKAARDQWKTPAGRGTSALLCAGISPTGIEVIHFVESKKPLPGEPHVLGQMVAVDHAMGCVVVALRGSSCFRDVLADLNCRPEELKLGSGSGHAHSGMLRMAHYLDEPLLKIVQEGLQKLSGPPRVLLCGHSLGAGVAALLTIIWNDPSRHMVADIRCLAFACPQILDARLSLEARSHTTSFIVGEDWVPCLSLATAMDLRDALVCLQDPEVHGLPHIVGIKEVRDAINRYDVGLLAEIHQIVREKTALTKGRLYPSGRLIHLTPGTPPREVDHAAVDEIILTKDMVFAHAPRRYLGAIQAAGAGSAHVTSLWPLRSSL